MKYKELFVIIGFFYTCIGCSKEEVLRLSKDEIKVYTASKLTEDTKRLIVQFKEFVPDWKKKALRLKYQVTAFDVCANCPDGVLELWLFGEGVDIEDKKASIKAGSGGPEGEIVAVNTDFKFETKTVSPVSLPLVQQADFRTKVVEQNTGVSIAVLDTGIYADHPAFTEAFLYNTSHLGLQDIAGWDFVNNDENCFDDHEYRHGTMVTYLLYTHLKERIPFQILPVKICDAKGTASYYNLLCGLYYALPKVQLVNISMGWYDSNKKLDMSIFENLLSAYKEEVTVICSAGNQSKNADQVGHYPSGFQSSNVISVAAANTESADSASFTNFGSSSVDFFAKGERIGYYNSEGAVLEISGTSFAAPLVTAVAARELHARKLKITPHELIKRLCNIGDSVVFSVPVKYNKLLH